MTGRGKGDVVETIVLVVGLLMAGFLTLAAILYTRDAYSAERNCVAQGYEWHNGTCFYVEEP